MAEADAMMSIELHRKKIGHATPKTSQNNGLSRFIALYRIVHPLILLLPLSIEKPLNSLFLEAIPTCPPLAPCTV